VVLMIWSSLYMVHLLHRHHRRAQHVHSASLYSQPSPESKATHSILFLESWFVLSLWLKPPHYILLVGLHPKLNQDLIKLLELLIHVTQTFVLIKNMKIISTFIFSFSDMKFVFLQRGLNGWSDLPQCH
jgi:vomeronasal1 receptor